MPYQRKYKKRTVRRAPRTQEKRIRKVVKSELKKEIETKYHDRYSTGNIDTTVVAVSPATGLVRGISPNSYIGNKIKLTSLEIRGSLIAIDVPYNLVRLLVIQMGAQTNVPTASYLFSTTGTPPPIFAPFNKDNQDQYRVLKDKIFRLSNDGVSSSNNVMVPFRMFFSGKKFRQLQFTTTSGNADGGDIYVCMISDSGITPNPTFQLSMRMNFTDA